MIDLTVLRRIRLHGGTAVHEVLPGRPLRTACGKPVKLTGPAGRTYDEPMPVERPVTCQWCMRAGDAPGTRTGNG